MSFAEQVVNETFKKHPVVFIFVLICMASMATWALNVFAQDKRVDQIEKDLTTKIESVETKVDTLDKNVKILFLEQNIQSLESNILNLERIERSGGAHPSELKALDEKRIVYKNKMRELRKLTK